MLTLRLFDRMLSLVRFPLLVVILVLLAPQTIISGVPIQNTLTRIQGDGGQANQTKIQANIAELPLSFIANAGQVDANVRFMVKAGAQIIFFTSEEVVFAASEETEGEDTRSSAVRLRFTGVNGEVKVEGEKPLPGVANFFLGNDPEQWRANVPTYAAITYQHLYPGIDLVYSGKQGRLKSEFVVAAGADPTLIIMDYSGVSSMYVREDGALVLETPIGELVKAPPLIYQMIGEERVTVEGGYRLLGEGQVAFTLGDYVPTEPLIIDPTFIYSTYLGGSNDDRVRGIAVDGSGNAYIIGETYCGDFPTQDPLQPNCSGNYDAFVAKLNTSGSVLIYSTYLGGHGHDNGWAIAVDDSGSAYITGYTESSNFPTQDPLQPNCSGEKDAFVAKLNTSGSALIYSTYLGG
ncbi:SBBP repeat-containing protein, partial [Candidatus Bipolaricaulota bacterium]|nr:SBBP repeat-containing protein [Candidatus Bipolaricaulota bacterium]